MCMQRSCLKQKGNFLNQLSLCKFAKIIIKYIIYINKYIIINNYLKLADIFT